MIKPAIVAATLVLGAASQAWAAMSADEFVQKAAVAGMFEVESSNLALERVDDAAVKDFAQEMVNDHSKANDKLKNLAQQEGLSVPSQMDEPHQKKMDELRKAGNDFRTQYVSMQVQAHDEAVKLFETYAQEGDNEALKGFAEETLPVLHDHHEDITAIQKGAESTR